MGDVVTLPRAKRQGPLRSVRVGVPLAFKFDLGAMLRERAQRHRRRGSTRRIVCCSTRPARTAPTLANRSGGSYRRLVAPLAGKSSPTCLSPPDRSRRRLRRVEA